MRFPRGTIAVLFAATTSACGPDAIVSPDRVLPLVASSPGAALVPLDPFGIGARVPGSRGCSAPVYRQFDFWVGNWDAYGGTTLIGTNIIRSRLDGCLIEENWTSTTNPFGFGSRGRSLNAYDAATGTWHQMWVSTDGCPNSIIYMEGTFENGIMVMTGRREQPLGFLFSLQCPRPPSGVAFAINNQAIWTPQPDGTVLQTGAVTYDDAPLPPPVPGGGLRYEPVATVTPLNPPTPSFCPFRPAARQFDFMLGSWTVHQGNGNGAQGMATFTSDLAQCLIEESFAGPGGYEGASFSVFDVFLQKWVRTYVDTDGQRIFMTGGVSDGKMVLVGARAGAGGESVQVRVTWDPVAAGRVVQRWEYSRDGGSSWQAGKEIVYTKG